MIVQKLKKEFKNPISDSLRELYGDIYVHDMKTIFTKIFMSAELCSYYIEAPDGDSEILHLLEVITEQIKRGRQLFKTKQKFEKIKTIKLDGKIIDINRVLNDVKNFIRKAYKLDKVSIKFENVVEHAKFHSEELLKIIFENILINAIKYNNKNRIRIIIKISEEKYEDVEYSKIEIMDNGIGVPDSKKEAIFTRNSKDKGGKGMGLGLSLVKEIVENLKGKIWVQDKIIGNYSSGSNFILLLPKLNE
ncbi:MAG: HAMP domain-containing histidine kinase [Candidatus Lokiarchaeota archaeon]|nr:HAMP domain-containing histidine kinase [Candidatus Lokiarchaeota archaeon]